jgi:hypothetical protein
MRKIPIATYFLLMRCYNAAMKKGRLREENVVKISITAKRAEEELYDYLLEKLVAKKKRGESN